MTRTMVAWASVLLLGCAADGQPEELGGSEASINGTINFAANCTAAQRTLVTNAMNIVVDQLSGGALLECLREAAMSNEPAGFPEEILRALGENKPTTIRCEYAEGYAGYAPHDVSNETMKLDPVYLNNVCGWSGSTCPSGVSAEEAVASLILHEVSHNKNYRHPEQSSAREYRYTVPEQLQKCSHSISRGAIANLPRGPVPLPTGAPRSDTLSRVELAAVGGAGGVPYIDQCGPSRFAKGLGVRTGSRVDALNLRCAGSDGNGDVYAYPAHGGDGGTASTMDCSPGSLMIGVSGRAQAGLDSVGVLCASASAIAAGDTGYGGFGPRGGSGGVPYLRLCPAGMAVKGLRGRDWTRIDQLILTCQPIDDPISRSTSNLAITGDEDGTRYRERCPSGALVSLFGQAAAKVDRVGGECLELLRVGNTLVGSGDLRAMPARGGRGGTPWAADACPSGEAIVGFNFRAGTKVDQIQAVCRSITAWGNLDNSTPVTLLAAHGGNGGTASLARCPGSYFVTGWDITVEDGLVTSIRGKCERF